MFPAQDDMSAGPPPPDARSESNPAVPAEMPPSIMASTGRRQAAQDTQTDSLKKQTVGLAMQALLEYKNSLEKLLTAMKAIDPESVALFIPAIETGKALESRFQQATQRGMANQPSMAGLPGGASAEPTPAGMSATGM